MTQQQIARFWLPLFASWLLMTAEGPLVSAVINRLPNEIIMLAALGIVTSLSITIESPIINLLATSTALVRDRATFVLVRRFTWHWMLGLTVIALLLAYTPMFNWVVVQLLAVPSEVAVWVRPGLQIMFLWSAAIAWRRFLQGVLIHFQRPQAVAWGTLWRLGSGATVAIGLALITDWPGVIVGSITLAVSVIVEALYATWAVQPLLRTVLSPQAGPADSEPPLTYGQLFRFHLPLAGTSLLALLVQPVVAFSLARLANPTLSLAAWPVLFQLLLLVRAGAMALPEVVIALNTNQQTEEALRSFILRLTVATAGLMGLLVFTPLSDIYLIQIQDAELAISQEVQRGLIVLVLFPALATINFGLRGLLISRRHTNPVNTGMLLNLGATTLALAGGVALRWSGISTAALALNIALILETVYLVWQAQKGPQVHLYPRSTAP